MHTFLHTSYIYFVQRIIRYHDVLCENKYTTRGAFTGVGVSSLTGPLAVGPSPLQEGGTVVVAAVACMHKTEWWADDQWVQSLMVQPWSELHRV